MLRTVSPTAARRIASLPLAAVLALRALPALAAGQPAAAAGPAPGGPATPPAVLAQLLLLADDACDVRYVPGSLDRAAHIEEWLRALAVGAARRIGEPMRLGALVLDRETWTKARVGCTYGIPCPVGGGIVALPSSGDAGTVSLWQGLLGELPSIGGMPLMGTPEEAASLWPADQIAGPLLMHALLDASGMRTDEPWLMELVAHALALDAAHQARSGQDELMVGFWHHVLERPEPPAGADPLTVELRRQARLFEAAEGIDGHERRLSLKPLRKMQDKANGVLRAADVRAEWPSALQRIPSAATH